MDNKLWLSLVFALFFSYNSKASSSILIPQNLRVEYMDCPKGLDVEKPRFSWVLKSESEETIFGQRQTGYRIMVGSTSEKIKNDEGDMWDSGWITGSVMINVDYDGKPLHSDRRYFWKVKVRDEKGLESEWSDIKWWTTGWFSESVWKGEWIGGKEEYDPSLAECNIWDPWLRKKFFLNEKPGKATLFIASIGYHEIYVNGKKVGDEILAPVVTDHTKRARYVAYDIQDYLQQGNNVIGIWLGTSWSIFPGYVIDDGRPLKPLATAQVDFYVDRFPKPDMQPFMSLSTDQTWKVKNSPNKLTGSWDFRNMGGEYWDDRIREDEWCHIDYDDSEWMEVDIYSLDLVLSAQIVEGNKKREEIKPVSIEEREDGSYRVDMGVNFAGWTEVVVRGEEGDKIEFLFSEREQDDITYNLRSVFVIGASGKGIFKNRFNYSSGRWITIRGLEKKPKLDDIRGWMVRTDFEEASYFKCSDPLQNWIYDRVLWTYENLSLGGFIVDCPQRERMGYGGDAHATSETGLLNYHLGAFYTKWMEDWRDVQGTEPMVGNMRDPDYARKEITSGRLMGGGILPHTAPTYWGGGGPAWGGIVVSLPWFMYEHYRDIRILEENFLLIKNWLSFLDTHVENDLLKRFGGTWDFLGDWLWPNATAEGMNNDSNETLCLNNSYRVFNLRTAAKIARILGMTEEAEKWEAQAEASAYAIHQRFYNHDKGIYSDGSMANLATALLADIVPRREREKVIDALEKEILINRNGHIHAGITGGALLFRWLRQEGRNDLIYSMVSQVDYPSWGYMKANGATTIWEMWEKDLPGHSLLHSSFLYPGAWYIDGVVGIRAGEPGYSEIVIDPPVAGEVDVEWAKGAFESPSGLIECEWNREDDEFGIAFTLPPNTTGLLKLSREEADIVIEKEGIIQKIGNEGDKLVFELVSGQYCFGDIW